MRVRSRSKINNFERREKSKKKNKCTHTHTPKFKRSNETESTLFIKFIVYTFRLVQRKCKFICIENRVVFVLIGQRAKEFFFFLSYFYLFLKKIKIFV
jgi:hypothetical protein